MGFEICAGMMVNHIYCPTPFSIPVILPILSPLSATEAGSNTNMAHRSGIEYTLIFMMFEYISYLGVITSIPKSSGVVFCDSIYA